MADPALRTQEEDRGRLAESPQEVPARGWWDIVLRTVREAKADGVPLLAAGVAFYALLALAPAVTALAGVYGLVAEPADASQQVTELLRAAPAEVRDLVEAQMVVATERSASASLALVLGGIALALWSASSGMRHLIGAINTAYDEDETRGFLKVRGLSLVLSAAAILFLAVSIGVIAVLPAALADTALGPGVRLVIGVLRWPALAAAMIGGLAVLYRIAPERDDPQWSWVALGSVVATGLWLAGSAAFSVYAANLGRYDDTYGALGAIVVVMLWLFLTAYCIVLGAELNAEAERQTAKDTTIGSSRPLGRRGAEAADTVGPTADEMKQGVPASANALPDHRRVP
jgi:membrane protein